MKILVTGGCGFIGSHLVNKLIGLGQNVIVLDNLSTGKKEYLNPKAEFMHGDIRKIDDVKAVIKDCNTVFHLAASTDVRADSDEIFAINSEGSQNVFSLAEKIGAKIIFTSSAAVYGETELAKEESDCKPISLYGESKLKAEHACPKDSFILRIFNAYGSRGNSVINKFCNKISKKEPITVYGSGLQTRDYVYVSDVIEALLLGFHEN